MTEGRRQVVAAVFVLVAVLILAATVLVIGLGLGATRTTRAVSAAVQRIDRALLEQNYDLAERHIVDIFPDARTAFDWIRLIARAHTVSEQRTEYSLFVQTCLAAVESVPGNQDLRALLVHAALLAGNETLAGEQAALHITSAKYSALAAEAFIRSGVLPSGFRQELLESIDENGLERVGSKLLVYLPESESPAHFEQAAVLSGDRRFLVNAVLFAMHRGETERAYRILERLAPTEYAAYLQFLLAYDAERYPEALAALSRMEGRDVVRPEVMMVHADILTRLARYEEAVALYRDVLATSPDFSPLLYMNLHALTLEEEFLHQGLRRYPVDRRILRRVVSLLHNTGRRSQALEAVQFVASESGYTAELRVYELLLTEMPYERRIALLWELEAELGPEELAAIALAGHLVAVRDYSGLERLLDRYPSGSFGVELDNYRAVHALRRLQAAEAAALMDQAVQGATEGDWITRFNAALVYIEAGRTSEAVPLLDQARSLVEPSPGHTGESVHLSEIVYRRALAGAILGEYRHAAQLAREAVEFNPDNFEARILLDNLAVYAP